jgi:hypothetical protein
VGIRPEHFGLWITGPVGEFSLDRACFQYLPICERLAHLTVGDVTMPRFRPEQSMDQEIDRGRPSAPRPARR